MAFTRPNDEWVQRLEQLQAQAQELSGLLVAASSTPASYEGRDRTGAVQVTVDHDGQIQDVGLGGSWRNHIDPRTLGPAVVEAVGAAASQRVAAWAESVATGARRQFRVARSAGGAAPEPVQTAPSPPFGDGLSGRRLLELLDGVEAELEGFQQQVRQRLNRGSDGRSDGGHVTAVVTGGQVNRLELDPQWVARARHTEIAREIRLALAQAQAADLRSKSAPGDMGTSFRELQAVAEDLLRAQQFPPHQQECR